MINLPCQWILCTINTYYALLLDRLNPYSHTPIMNRKSCALNIVKIDQQDENIGRISAIASTFGNIDRVGDIIGRQAFDETVKDLREKDTMLPSLFNHDPSALLGGIPAKSLEIKDTGLHFTALLDRSVPKAQEVYSLAKKGFLNNSSIGFTPDAVSWKEDDGDTIRTIDKAGLIEISFTPIPANPEALITDVKTATPFKNFPLADEGVKWDSTAAIARVREKTGSEDSPSATYRNAFMYYDPDNADDFGAYKLPYVDVIDGEMKAVPRAIFAIAAVLNGGRGGVDIPESGIPAIKAHVDRYYSKMGRDSPFEDGGDKSLIFIEDLETLLMFKQLNRKLREELLCP